MDKDLLRRRLMRLKGSKIFSVADMARYLDYQTTDLWKIISGHDTVSNPLQIRLTIVFQDMDAGLLVPVQGVRKNQRLLVRRAPTVIAKTSMPRINFGELSTAGVKLEFD